MDDEPTLDETRGLLRRSFRVQGHGHDEEALLNRAPLPDRAQIWSSCLDEPKGVKRLAKLPIAGTGNQVVVQ